MYVLNGKIQDVRSISTFEQTDNYIVSRCTKQRPFSVFLVKLMARPPIFQYCGEMGGTVSECTQCVACNWP